jgi:hypothetical protein
MCLTMYTNSHLVECDAFNISGSILYRYAHLNIVPSFRDCDVHRESYWCVIYWLKKRRAASSAPHFPGRSSACMHTSPFTSRTTFAAAWTAPYSSACGGGLFGTPGTAFCAFFRRGSSYRPCVSHIHYVDNIYIENAFKESTTVLHVYADTHAPIAQLVRASVL